MATKVREIVNGLLKERGETGQDMLKVEVQQLSCCEGACSWTFSILWLLISIVSPAYYLLCC